MPREIVITVKPGGEVESNLIGFEGKTCEDIAAPLGRALGHVVDSKKKPEYYKTTKNSVRLGK